MDAEVSINGIAILCNRAAEELSNFAQSHSLHVNRAARVRGAGPCERVYLRGGGRGRPSRAESARGVVDGDRVDRVGGKVDEAGAVAVGGGRGGGRRWSDEGRQGRRGAGARGCVR